MKLFQIFLCGAAALSVLLFTGCDNSEPKDLPAIEQASNDGSGQYGPDGTLLSSDGGWVAGSDLNAIGGAGNGVGGWPPVDPEGNLGFPIIYFGYDTDELPASETAKLNEVASYMSNQPELGLIIEGHCDQRGTEEYNRALGERRANSIRVYLTGCGVNDSRIRTISYGEDRPAVQGEGESAWGKNRRGVLVPARMN